jgi:hypothetical protein
MIWPLPKSLVGLLVLQVYSTAAFPGLPDALVPSFYRRSINIDVNPNGSTFIWVITDTYTGTTFFEYVDMPTHTPYKSRICHPTAAGTFFQTGIQRSMFSTSCMELSLSTVAAQST